MPSNKVLAKGLFKKMYGAYKGNMIAERLSEAKLVELYLRYRAKVKAQG